MPVGLLGIDWDEAAQRVTLRYDPPKADIVFKVSDIPQNIARTVSTLQTWCDANLQAFMVALGMTGFIKVAVRVVSPTIKFDFVVTNTQAQLDAYIFAPYPPINNLPPGAP